LGVVAGAISAILLVFFQGVLGSGVQRVFFLW
jgi:hypothetical protein